MPGLSCSQVPTAKTVMKAPEAAHASRIARVNGSAPWPWKVKATAPESAGPATMSGPGVVARCGGRADDVEGAAVVVGFAALADVADADSVASTRLLDDSVSPVQAARLSPAAPRSTARRGWGVRGWGTLRGMAQTMPGMTENFL